MLLAEQKRATIDDLHRVPGKAELVDGRIIRFMSTGLLHGLIAANILVLLRDLVKVLGYGVAVGDGVGYTVLLLPSGRESFSPDVSFYDGPLPANLVDFIPGAPTLAVEIRSKNDYGRYAETQMAAKRADYFLAGTKAVWDVDPDNRCVHVFRCTDPDTRLTFASGQIIDAEPAMPGWRVNVDDVFRK